MNDEEETGVPRLSRTSAVIAVLIVAGIPGGLLYFTHDLFTQRARSRESERWPHTQAEILDASVDSSLSKAGRLDHQIIHYRYTVAGRSYLGDRVSLQLGYTRGECEAMVKRWPPGSTTTVWYQPADPGLAVLEPKSWDGGLFLGFIVIVDAVLSLAGLAGVAAIALASVPLRWVRRLKRSA